MQEIWKDIAGYEGTYQISSYGNVRRITSNGYSMLKPSNRLYADVDLSINGEHHRQAIHRMVALHFLPNPRNCSEVNHKDGNKHNNNVENLEWVTQEENMQHARKVLGNYPFGKKPRPVHKIDVETNEIIQTYESVSQAGYEIVGKLSARTAITNCCNGKMQSAYGYKWKYAD